MRRFKIISTGYCIPKTLVSNDDLSKLVDTSDEWITSRTGIKSRYIANEETIIDLGVESAKRALKDNIDINKIRIIICATISADTIMPSTASTIQHKLGLSHQDIMAFDINAACSGYIYALELASNLLKEDEYALVIGAEVLSKVVNWKDRNTCVLFGDGAGCALICLDNSVKQYSSYMGAQSDVDHYLYLKGLNNINKMETKQQIQDIFIEMNGKEVFKFAIEAIPACIDKVCHKCHINYDEIDLIIPHQANIRIIQYVAKKMKIDMNKFFINLDTYGNTSSASIAIALAQAYEQNLIKEGMKIVLVGFGGGFTSGAILIEI